MRNIQHYYDLVDRYIYHIDPDAEQQDAKAEQQDAKEEQHAEKSEESGAEE